MGRPMGDALMEISEPFSALSVLVSRATATGDWLVEEAAYLEQGLLSSSKRLAQVRLELQVCALSAFRALPHDRVRSERNVMKGRACAVLC